MTQTLLKIAADFDVVLQSKVAVGATTATLSSVTDDDGDALANGTYGLTIDGNNSKKEYIICTLTGTSLSSIVSIDRQGATTSGFVREHRKGASVKITDWAIMKRMLSVLDGTTNLDSATVLAYDGAPTFTPGSNQLATIKYADDLAIAGSPNASTTQKGISEEATQAEIDADTATGGTSARLFVNPSTLVTSKYGTRLPTANEKTAIAGNNTDIAVGSGNKLVTQTGLQKAAEVYAATATGNDTYVVTLSPAPTSLTNGMLVRVKVDVGNTGPCTLNVNGLGAVAIKKFHDQDTATGDIEAGQILDLVYNSTGPKFQLQSQMASTGSRRLHSFTTNVVVASSTTETDLMTFTLPGGLLSTANIVRGYVNFSALRNDGTTCTLRLKYGATTISTITINVGTFPSVEGKLRFELYAAGATNSQEGVFELDGYTSASFDITGGDFAMMKDLVAGTATEDSTADKTLAISVQFGTNSAADTMTAINGYAELIA